MDLAHVVAGVLHGIGLGSCADISGPGNGTAGAGIDFFGLCFLNLAQNSGMDMRITIITTKGAKTTARKT